MEKVVEKKIVSLFLAMALILGFAAYLPKLELTADASAKSTTSGFYVDGTKIRDANGQEFVMRGINHAHLWYRGYADSAISDIANTGANTIRLVCGDGFYPGWKKTSASELESIIKKALDKKMVPIVEIHDHTGATDEDQLQRAVNYWLQDDVKNVLKTYEKYVILNIANEWYGGNWNDRDGQNWANGYKSAIPQLRNAGINNLIMVDGPGYGQDTNNAVKYCKEVFNADTNGNTVISHHLYEYGGGSDSKVKSAIDGVLNNGIPVVIGEFANEHKGNYVACDYIMQYCQEKGVGYIGWSWCGNGDEVKACDIVNDWNPSSPTTFGQKILYGSNGIKNTSKQCSIFSSDFSIPDNSSSKVESSSKVDSSSKSSSKADDSNVSGQAVTVWSGTCEIGTTATTNWSEMVDFELSNIPYARAGGKLKFTYQPSADASDETPPQIQFVPSFDSDWLALPDPDNEDNEFFTFDPEGTTYTYTITEDDWERLAYGGKIIMKGQNCILKQLDYICAPGQTLTEGKSTEVWSGEFKLGNWTDPTEPVAENIANAKEGGIVSIYYTPDKGISNNPQIQLATKTEETDWEWTGVPNFMSKAQFSASKTGSVYHILLTAKQAKQLANADEVWMKGQLATITKITYTEPNVIVGGEIIHVDDSSSKVDSSSVVDGPTTTNIYKGTLALGNWEGYANIAASKFKNAKVGDVLRITVSGVTGDETKVVFQKDWEDFGCETDAFSATKTTADIVITADTLAVLKTGVIVKGCNATLKQIDLISGLSDNSIIDASSKNNDSSSKVVTEKETVVAEKNVSDFGWNDSNVIKFNLSGYDSAKIVAKGSCSYIKLGVESDDKTTVPWTVLVEPGKTSSKGVYTYNFTAAQLKEFSTDVNLFIQGQDGSLSNVQVIGVNKVVVDNSQADSSSSKVDSSSKTDSSSKVDSSSSKADSSSKSDSSSKRDSSSEIEIGDDYILDKKVVKHQLKNNGDTIRFIMIADESKIGASKSGDVEVRVKDMNDLVTDPVVIKADITSVYKTVYAGGKKLTAPAGKVYIISPEASGVSQEGWGALGLFKLDSAYPPRYASMYQNGFMEI